METNFPEWVKKAESDWKAVRILNGTEDSPGDVIVFHCQQVAEKYLKAYLSKSFGPIQKTHNLLKLAADVAKSLPSVNLLRNDLLVLNEYSVSPRYPGDFAEPTATDVSNAIASAKRIRYFFRKALGIAAKRKRS